MRIVCIGDSMTFGYKIPRAKTWIALVQQQLGVELINCGVTGDTSGGMLARFERALLENRPDAVFIMGGVNDLINGAWIGTVQSNLAAMAHQAMARQIVPILTVPAPLRSQNIRSDWCLLADFVEVDRQMVVLREWLLLFGQIFHVDIIDLYRFFQSYGEADDLYQADGIHLTQAGHRLAAGFLSRELAVLPWIQKGKCLSPI